MEAQHGRGRGRGRGQTLPAWMTQPANSKDLGALQQASGGTIVRELAPDDPSYQSIQAHGFRIEPIRDDHLADQLDKNAHLLPWGGKKSGAGDGLPQNWMDRYDGRMLLQNREDFIKKKGFAAAAPEDAEAAALAAELDAERYRG
eukprot:CAMPEP_0194694392 /NCGR_PEP_ID=MMETSP0295-20121207/21228_1 /TAXON_ID=39354 /ORGANISM="Heterosigma akashiwo, Strain CCMP2393" /LENGTH=144 /DNA_ID=CAMNT_0039585713 /DNA_START=19 /DNA_END=449 /DNA_ORIENTATION=+